MIVRAQTRIRIAALSLLAAPSTDAQSLADRVADTRNGAVSFTFAPRPGVCGDGDSFIRLGHSYFGNLSRNMRAQSCESGPVQVRLTMRDGDVDRVETWVGPVRSHEARALGMVSAPEAARYLLSVASRSQGTAGKAILPAVLADSAIVWPALLMIARDTTGRSRNTRQEAAFWLSRFAAAAISGHRTELWDDDDGEEKDDVKAHAMFVLSQLAHGGGVEQLLDIAQSNPDRRVRSKALFWLGQSGDSRALSLFEALLKLASPFPPRSEARAAQPSPTRRPLPRRHPLPRTR